MSLMVFLGCVTVLAQERVLFFFPHNIYIQSFYCATECCDFANNTGYPVILFPLSATGDTV